MDWTDAQRAAITAERQRMIREGQGMDYKAVSAWLTGNAELPLGRAAATLQLVDALGERIVYIPSIESPLVIKCDVRHEPHQPRSGRYHVEI